jgi:WD40 repeat protein
VGGVGGALLVYFVALTVLSDARVMDTGPVPGTLSYAPQTLVVTGRIPLSGPAALMAYSPNGALVATSVQGSLEVAVRRAADGAAVSTIASPAALRHLVFTPDGRQLVADDEAGRVYVWQTATGVPSYPPLVGQRGPLVALQVSGDGQRVLVAAADGTVVFYQLADGRVLRQDAVAALTGGAAFSEDGSNIAYGTPDALVIYSLDRDEIRISIPAGRGSFAAFTFSHLGGIVAATRPNGNVEIYQVTTGELVHTLANPALSPGAAPAGSFSADARIFAAAQPDGGIRLWDVRAGTLRATLTGHSVPPVAFGFTDDGQHMASAGGTNVLLWSLP